MDAHIHDVDAYMAARYPDLYAAPATPKQPSIDEAVLKPITPGRPSARRSERSQAREDLTKWLAYIIACLAELDEPRPSREIRLEAPRKASLERGRPVRRHH